MQRRPLQQPAIVKRDWRSPGPVALKFLKSDALVCGIRGPFGSAKSTTCVLKLIFNAQLQKPGPDGVARRRTAIIRNTYGMLETTTAKTWTDWIPKTVGRWSDKAPPRHLIATPNFEWEVLFIALDRPEDVAKLLSMDLSDAWVNEAREIPKEIIDGLTGRVGRFPRTIYENDDPSKKVLHSCANPQIIMDTNSPDTDHWWAKWADFRNAEVEARDDELARILREKRVLHEKQKLQEFFAQPSGRSAKAENLMHLRPGYYEWLMAGKSEDWIKVYVDGEYGFVQEGKPVYPEYRDSTHCLPFELNRALPIYVGIDFGLTPAATFGQRTPMGSWRIFMEFVTEDMGALEFGQLLAQLMRERFAGYTFAGITGDPAGNAQAQTDKNTPFQMLRVSGIEALPAITNDFTKRRETFAWFLNRMVDGNPGLLVHPQCVKLRRALAGGYHYQRIQVSGMERYQDKPVKDMNSHVAESAQYMLLGAGEAQTVLRANPEFRRNRQVFAIGIDRNPLEGY